MSSSIIFYNYLTSSREFVAHVALAATCRRHIQQNEQKGRLITEVATMVLAAPSHL